MIMKDGIHVPRTKYVRVQPPTPLGVEKLVDSERLLLTGDGDECSEIECVDVSDNHSNIAGFNAHETTQRLAQESFERTQLKAHEQTTK